MSLGLGDIDKAALNGITDKLIAAVPGIEQPIIAELHADIAALVQAETDGISQAGAQVLTLEEPVLQRIDTLNENTARLLAFAEKFAAFSNGFDISVTPKQV